MELYDDENEEHKSLRKVPGKLNWMLFAVCVVEMGERFVYNGISGPLQNYVQSVLSKSALGIIDADVTGEKEPLSIQCFWHSGSLGPWTVHWCRIEQLLQILGILLHCHRRGSSW
jgi:hypothetical protein